VSGGFALTHGNSVTDIAVVEAAKLEDIDPEEVPRIYAEAVKDMNAAADVRASGGVVMVWCGVVGWGLRGLWRSGGVVWCGVAWRD
jgi:ribosome biogenesis SPOUT family RNA methylase Rps3